MPRSLYEQLNDAEQKLALIEERKAEYVVSVDIPLQLVAEARVLEEHSADLRARIERLRTHPCPYRGLAPFEADQAALFFGREAMIARLVDQVAQQQLTLVIGPSGSGKSSLIRAGLMVALSQPFSPLAAAWLQSATLRPRSPWRVGWLTPGRDPLHALAAHFVAWLEPDLGEVDRLLKAGELADHWLARPHSVETTLQQILRRYQDTTLLTIIDQFEELFTSPTESARADLFVQALLALVRTSPQLRIVLAMRADFYDPLTRNRTLIEAIGGTHFHILPLSRSELRAAIEQPAFRLGSSFTPKLVDRIIDDVADEPGNLPLLQFALTELWEHQTRDGVMTDTAYNEIGGVEQALARYADEIYAKLSQTEQRQVRRILLQLVQVGEQVPNTRRLATRSEIGEQRWPLVSKLADTHLIVTGRGLGIRADDGKTASDTAEVAHEALIRGWQTLRDWIGEEREFLTWLDRLHTAHRQWLASEKDEGALLHGVLLTEAERWLGLREDDLSSDDIAFIHAGVALRDREARERQQALERELALAEAQREIEQRRKEALERELALAEAEREAEQNRKAVLERDLAYAQQLATTEQRNTRRLRAILAVVGALLLLAVGLAFITQQARQQSETLLTEAQRQKRIAQAEALAAQSQEAGGGQPQRSALLAREAISTTHGLDGIPLAHARQSLFDALSRIGGQSLPGHTGGIWVTAFRPDGNQLITGGEDRTGRLWDLTSSPPTSIVLPGHTNQVRVAAWSRGGRFLATGDLDGTALLWDTTTTPPTSSRLPAHGGALLVALFSADDRFLITASTDGRIRRYDLTAAQGLQLTSTVSVQNDVVRAAAVHPNGRYLATGGNKGAVRIWSLDGGGLEMISQPPAHAVRVLAVAWLEDGQRLISVSEDNVARLWDMRDITAPALALDLPGPPSTLRTAVVSPQGRWLATGGGSDNNVTLWDLHSSTTAARPQLLRGHTKPVWTLSFSADETMLLSGGDDNQGLLWDLTTVYPGARPRILRGHDRSVLASAFRPSDPQLITGGYDGTLRLWDVRSPLFAANPIALPGGSAEVRAVAFSPGNGAHLAAGYNDGTVRLWERAGDTTTVRVLGQHRDAVLALAFTAAGDQLIGVGKDASLLRWDLSASSPAHTSIPIPLGPHRLLAVALNATGERLAVACDDGAVRVWEHITAAPLGQPKVFPGHRDTIEVVAFSPDGRLLASGDRRATVLVWDLSSTPSSPPPTALRTPAAITSALAVTNAGQVAVGSYELITTTITVWKTRPPDTSARPLVLTGHTLPVVSLAFDTTGNQLASGSWDDSVRLWHLTDPLPAANPLILRSHNDNITSLAWTSDDQQLAVGGRDGTLHIWQLNIDTLLEVACRAADRNLTLEEWTQFFAGEPPRKTCPGLPDHWSMKRTP